MPVDRRFGIVRCKKRFGKGLPMPGNHAIDKPLRMAVADREVFRQLNVTLGELSEDSVDKPAGTGKTAGTAQLNTFTDCRAGRNPVVEENLISPQTENIPHRSIQFFLPGKQRINNIVQQHIVLQNTEGKAGCKGSVPIVKICNGAVERLLGPGSSFKTAVKHCERCSTCARHQSLCPLR